MLGHFGLKGWRVPLAIALGPNLFSPPPPSGDGTELSPTFGIPFGPNCKLLVRLPMRELWADPTRVVSHVFLSVVENLKQKIPVAILVQRLKRLLLYVTFLIS